MWAVEKKWMEGDDGIRRNFYPTRNFLASAHVHHLMKTHRHCRTTARLDHPIKQAVISDGTDISADGSTLVNSQWHCCIFYEWTLNSTVGNARLVRKVAIHTIAKLSVRLKTK